MKEEIKMSENKNIELSDEMMATVTGGNSDISGPKYEIGDQVSIKFANDEGVVTVVTGHVTDRKSTPGGWQYLIRYEVNGTTYDHWYPEIAV